MEEPFHHLLDQVHTMSDPEIMVHWLSEQSKTEHHWQVVEVGMSDWKNEITKLKWVSFAECLRSFLQTRWTSDHVSWTPPCSVLRALAVDPRQTKNTLFMCPLNTWVASKKGWRLQLCTRTSTFFFSLPPQPEPICRNWADNWINDIITSSNTAVSCRCHTSYSKICHILLFNV